MRVLVANEPRASREAISEALKILRPGVEITLGDPESLERDSGFEVFDLVLHTGRDLRAAGLAETDRPPALIDLHPGDLPVSHVEIDGECSTVLNIDLEDLISIVDRLAAHTADAVEKR